MTRPRIRRHDGARTAQPPEGRSSPKRTRSKRAKRREGQPPDRAPLVGRVREITPAGHGLVVLEDDSRVFVGGVIDGETVRVTLESGSRRQRRARLVEVLEASPDRVEPPCPHVDRCGGCDLMHLAEEARCELHRRQATRLLSGVGHLQSLPTIGHHRPSASRGYRSRARFLVKGSPGTAHVGYRGARSHKLVEIEPCMVLRTELDATPSDLAVLLAGSTGKGQAQVAIGADAKPVGDIHWEGELAGAVFGRAAELCRDGRWAGIQLWPELAREPARYGDPRPVVAGPDGQQLQIAPGGFAQPSDEAGVALARHVAELLEPSDQVVELFAGSGTLSAALSRRVTKLVAIETSVAAVSALRDNLSNRGLDARVVTGDANQARISSSTTAVVLDPPRAGARGAVGRILAARPRRVVYVSCHPASLSRDVRDLTAGGYGMDRLELFDLFPQTSHFESVARLVR